MNFYLDCEFDGWMGPLISLALVREDGEEFYWAIGDNEGRVKDPWVRENVLPILRVEGAEPNHVNGLAEGIQRFVGCVENVHIIADWPDDIAYFCRAMIVGAGQRIDTPPLTFEVRRVDAYPTKLTGAVRHNALWDARALKAALAA